MLNDKNSTNATLTNGGTIIITTNDVLTNQSNRNMIANTSGGVVGVEHLKPLGTCAICETFSLSFCLYSLI
jgi:hypothetical protein